jgi:hypothetical protein
MTVVCPTQPPIPPPPTQCLFMGSKRGSVTAVALWYDDDVAAAVADGGAAEAGDPASELMLLLVAAAPSRTLPNPWTNPVVVPGQEDAMAIDGSVRLGLKRKGPALRLPYTVDADADDTDDDAPAVRRAPSYASAAVAHSTDANTPMALQLKRAARAP